MLSAEVQEQTKAAVEALSTRSIRSFSIFRRSKKDKKPKSSGQRLLLPAAEMLLLSKSKLEAMEAAHRLEDLAERQHAESCFAIQKGTAQRLPIVQEILDGTAETTIDGLEEQLEALRVELRSLDSQRREDELALKRSEREVATEVADFRYQKLQREQDLQQQLQEEEMISDALTKLIADQAEIIAKLQSFD
eukprot:g8573.t1